MILSVSPANLEEFSSREIMVAVGGDADRARTVLLTSQKRLIKLKEYVYRVK